jgi:1-acyl-sn-glycerol-3-phosphate acyltransferase
MFRAIAIAICLFLNLALWGTLVLLGGLVKLLTFGELRRRVIRMLPWLAERWAAMNDLIFDTFLTTRWELEGMDELRRDEHYLVISNHISWIDIFAVVRAFHGRAPFVRFFLKHTLVWAPFVGQAAWALGFPFMRRYSAEYLRQHPEKRGRDLETTRIACRRFRHLPVTIINYIEGTRFSAEKQEAQDSPYRYLLRPRVGGIGFVLASLSEQIDALYDLTIIYPTRDVSMLDFIRNRVPWIRMILRRIDVPNEFRTDAITEPGPARDHFKQWVEQIWRDKDNQIAEVVAGCSVAGSL